MSVAVSSLQDGRRKSLSCTHPGLAPKFPHWSVKLQVFFLVVRFAAFIFFHFAVPGESFWWPWAPFLWFLGLRDGALDSFGRFRAPGLDFETFAGEIPPQFGVPCGTPNLKSRNKRVKKQCPEGSLEKCAPKARLKWPNLCSA